MHQEISRALIVQEILLLMTAETISVRANAQDILVDPMVDIAQSANTRKQKMLRGRILVLLATRMQSKSHRETTSRFASARKAIMVRMEWVVRSVPREHISQSQAMPLALNARNMLHRTLPAQVSLTVVVTRATPEMAPYPAKHVLQALTKIL